MANDATTQSMTIPTGTDVVKLYADLQTQLAQLKIQATGLALSHDENMAQIGQQANATAAQLQAAMAQVAAQQQANAQRYDIDLKNYGLSVADLNFRQRSQQLNAQLQTIAQGVDVVRQRTETGMANYQQRQGALNSKLQIADMLASRKGPQNFYAYNSLLNTLSPDAPGGGSTTVDPFQWVNGLVQPISDQLPSWAQSVNPNPNTINQPYTAQAGNAGTVTGGGSVSPSTGGAGVTSAPSGGSAAGQSALAYLDSVLKQAPAAQAAAQSTGPTGFPIAQVNKGWNLITMGPGGDVNRSDFDPSIQKVYGADAYDQSTGQIKQGATEATGTIKAGSPVWVYRAAQGGMFGALNSKAGAKGKPNPKLQPPSGRRFQAKVSPKPTGIGPVVTGDAPSGMPTGNEEMVSVDTNDPNAKLNIQPANGDGLAAQAGGDPGTQATSAISAIQQGLAALSAAVAELTGKASSEPSLLNASDPSMASGMPHAASGGTFTPPMADTGPMAIPDQEATSFTPPRADTGPMAIPDRNQPMAYRRGSPVWWSSFPSGFGGGWQSIVDRWRNSSPWAWGSAQPTARWGDGAYGTTLRGVPHVNSLPRFATGGTVGQPTNAGGGPEAFDYYGTGTTTPTLTYSKYTPEQLGNMPFLQKLFHGASFAPFQGWGQQVSNPSIGIANFPSLLNLQRYNALQPTEQDLTQSLAEQGLGLDFRDLLARSQAAAPRGATFATAGYRR